MANQSGSLTSSSGIATITASPNDTLTVTPTSGSFTLEYPLGTVLASGISATTTYSLTAGGQARLMCITGSVAYSLTDNPDAYVLTQAQAATTQSLVAGLGTLWAARPSAAANPGMLLQVSDIGGAGGMLLRSDGSNWYPLGGSAVLLNRSGSLATPVASLTSAGAAILMGAPVAGFKIPAGLLVPGRSKLRVEGYWNKTGATAAINCIVCFGTTNSFSDTQTGGQFIGAAATSVWRQFTEFYFHASNAFTESSVSVAPGNPAGATATALRNTNIDTAVDQYINWGTTNSSAGDGLQLINVTVTLFQ